MLSPFTALLIALCFQIALADGIPGCLDLGPLTDSLSELNRDDLNRIRCVCSKPFPNQTIDAIQVSCVFGSTIDDLVSIMKAAEKRNNYIHSIYLNHVAGSDNGTTLMDALSFDSAKKLKEIDIRNCRSGSLAIGDAANVTFQDLMKATIENCGLTEIPTQLFDKTNKVKTLILRRNKIDYITVQQLQSVASSLEYLDLTENLIADMEPGSLKQLKMIETVLIGEHNYANATIIEELLQIESLKTLDLTRIDGISAIEDFSMPDHLNLERLILTGCNLKTLNASGFSPFSEMKELDLKVNLVEKLEPDCFEGLGKLQRLSLAGNFLRELDINPLSWMGLESLEDLDLSWNDMKTLKKDSFGAELGKTLQTLRLQSNERLKTIENMAFNGLNALMNLNLSDSAIENIQPHAFDNLSSLQALDLSGNEIHFLPDLLFEPLNGTLKNLNLAHNNFSSFNVSILSEALEEVDFSSNPWICDKKIFELVAWIKQQYENSAKNSATFLLINAADTVCDRPYSLKGKSIMDITVGETPDNYDPASDIIPTTETPSTLAFDNITDGFDLSKFTIVPGQSGNNFLNNSTWDNEKPQYRFEDVQYGTTGANGKTDSKLLIFGLSLFFGLTVAAVIIAIRRNRHEENPAATAS